MLDEPYCSVKADSNICIYTCHSRSGGLRPPQQATIRITIRLGAECVHSMIIRSDGGRNPIGRRTQSDWTADANGEKSLGCVSLEMSVEPKINPEVHFYWASGRIFMLFAVLPDSNN